MSSSTNSRAAVSFLLPAPQGAFRQRHAELFAALTIAGADVAELIIEPGVQTMEQALFVLSNEMRESDVVVMVDDASPDYDFVELSERARSSFPTATVVLLAAKPSNAVPAVFETAKSLGMVIADADAEQIAHLCQGAPPDEGRVLKNDALARYAPYSSSVCASRRARYASPAPFTASSPGMTSRARNHAGKLASYSA